MNRFCLQAKDTSTKKTIYKAKRTSLSTFSVLSKVSENVDKEKIKNNEKLTNSPTPVKCGKNNFDYKFENLESSLTQDAFLPKDFKSYGKRERNEIEIRETKKYKTSNGPEKQKFLFLVDDEEKNPVGFKCFFETEIIDNLFFEKPEQDEDDCATSSSQIQYCKEYLDKELQNAINDAV